MTTPMPESVARHAPSAVGRRGRPRPRWLFPTLTLLLFALFQECLFRLLFPLPEVAGFNRISYQMSAQGHPQLKRMMDRGLVYDRLLLDSWPDGFSEIHNLNVYGFRGPDFAMAPASGRRRILLIGDSVTEGIGAADSATIPAQLQRLLDHEGVPAEVINLGVTAATLNHILLLSRDAIPLLKPQDVVIVLYANDLPAQNYLDMYDRPGGVFTPSAFTFWMPRVAALIVRYIHDQPICVRWVHRPIRFFPAVPDSANPWTQVPERPDRLLPALYDAMREGTLNPWVHAQTHDIPIQLAHDFQEGGSPVRYIKRIQAICNVTGARLTLAYVPFCGVISCRYTHPLIEEGMDPATAEALATDAIYQRQNQLLSELCQKLELPLADATADVKQAEEEGMPQYWEYDTHPRPAGYATIARRIFQTLRADSRLMPRASATTP